MYFIYMTKNGQNWGISVRWLSSIGIDFGILRVWWRFDLPGLTKIITNMVLF